MSTAQVVNPWTTTPGPVLLAFDDTDGPQGGCTTHLVFHVLLALPDLALRGMPRLVRLNPNVPWKTRGNGAVVLPLGRPRGPWTRVGELQGREVRAYPDAAPVEPSDEILEHVKAVLWQQARPEADPGVVLLPERAPSLLYWNAVRGVVSQKMTGSLLHALPGTKWAARGDGRGLVGALAAAAWPGPPSSYEFIAYRDPRHVGKPRQISEDPLWRLDGTGITFHTVDREADRVACIPNTPCPVLCGLRGTEPERLRDTAVRVLSQAAKEPVDGWLLWATNQGSGDHVHPVRHIGEVQRCMTVQLEASVTGVPHSGPGGHVIVPLRDAMHARFDAIAFEPTKDFRDVVRLLRPWDKVTVVGAWKERAVQLEKLQVKALADHRTKSANPACCGKSMKSRGEGAGYKCLLCSNTASDEDAHWEAEDRALCLGWHEVPVIARRHLHRPLAWEQLPPV